MNQCLPVFLSLGFCVGGIHAQATSALTRHVRFVYTGGDAQWRPVLLHTPSGIPLELSLLPDETTGQVTGLELQISRTRGDTSENLLDPPGDFHGLQAADFEAWDLHSGSMYSNPRQLRVRNLGLQVTVLISAPEIVQTGTAGFAFKHLRLDITIQRMSPHHKLDLPKG